MLIKNISNSNINLRESGRVKPGEEGEANDVECKLLFANNRIKEVAPTPPAPPAPPAKPAKSAKTKVDT